MRITSSKVSILHFSKKVYITTENQQYISELHVSASEFLLKLQLWVMQDNVSNLKKRYLFFSALIVYALTVSPLLTILYCDPISKLWQVQYLAFFIVYESLLIGLLFSLISMGFIHICRWIGIRNLYSSMLLLAVLETFCSVLFYGSLWRSTSGMLFLDKALEFGSVVGIAWLSLCLNRLFSRKNVTHFS